MSLLSAREYEEYHEKREELIAPEDLHPEEEAPGIVALWAKCAGCEEFLHTDAALRLDGLHWHPDCLSDTDRVRAIEAEESEGLDEKVTGLKRNLWRREGDMLDKDARAHGEGGEVA